MLVLRRIEVTYRLRLDADADRDKVQRAFEHHPRFCPVHRSIEAAIEFDLALDLV